MSLQCAITLNVGSVTAGQTPPAQATLTVYNPNAVAVAVTGVNITSRALGAGTNTTTLPSVPPLGPGQPTVIAALSSQTFGPFPVVAGSAAAINAQAAVTPVGNQYPVNSQPSQPSPFVLMIGGMVYGSDGSSNIVVEAPLLVSAASQPALGYQGGFAMFNAPNNACMLIPLGVL